MPEQQPTRPDPGPTAPQTDPTNPQHQEATGEWVSAERSAVRRQNEPGLMESDRDERAPTE